jgi:hypothetical protein
MDITPDPRLRHSNDFLGRNPLMLIDGNSMSTSTISDWVSHASKASCAAASLPTLRFHLTRTLSARGRVLDLNLRTKSPMYSALPRLECRTICS